MTVVIDCSFIEDHRHEYPDDWLFGGANGLHPGMDPRFESTVYEYLDGDLKPIHRTVVPTCDFEALDGFTQWQRFKPVYLIKREPNDKKFKTVLWKYDYKTDEVNPL